MRTDKGTGGATREKPGKPKQFSETGTLQKGQKEQIQPTRKPLSKEKGGKKWEKNKCLGGRGVSSTNTLELEIPKKQAAHDKQHSLQKEGGGG